MEIETNIWGGSEYGFPRVFLGVEREREREREAGTSYLKWTKDIPT